MYHDEREIIAEQMIEKLELKLPDFLDFPADDGLLLMLIVIAGIGKPPKLQTDLSQELLQKSIFASMNRKKLAQLVRRAERLIGPGNAAGDLLIHLTARLIAARLDIDYRHPKLVAAMVGTIQSTLSTPLLEVMPTTGELSLGLLGPGLRSSFSMMQSTDRYQDDLISLRLAVDSIKANFATPDLYRRLPESTFVLDAPYPDQGPTLGALNQVLTSRCEGRLVLIQNWSQASTTETWKSIRKVIEGRAHIEAIINFSSLPVVTDHCTAIILSTRQSRGDTLYMDVSMSNTLLSMDGIERMLLAGCIYNLWQGRDSHRNEEYLPNQVARFVNSYFRDGFRPISGLCNTSSRLPKAIVKKRLASREFLDVLPANSAPRELTDNSRVISDMLVMHPKVCCIYVIGNNGEGKSFLLSDIVYRLCKEQRCSVGIPMSPADRFPQDDALIKPYFVYKGAGSKLIMAEIRMISSHPDKVALLNTCLGMVGFGLRTFLILKTELSLDRYGNPRRDRLDLASKDDMLYLNSERRLINEYTVNFVREQHRTIAFENLSSGEQSILGLLIKIIASNVKSATFLIDEPEISLHVSWQQRLPRILTLLSSRLDASFVVATHSPVLIANAAEEDICYVSNIGKLKEIPVDERHSVETLLMDGFETYTPHNREVHERCAKLVASLISAVNESDATVQAKEATDKLEKFEETILKNVWKDKRKDSDLDLVQKTLAAVAMLLKERASRHG